MPPSVSTTSDVPEKASELAVLIACLQNAGVDWDGENVADLLWLARYIDPPAPRDNSTGTTAPERDSSVRIEIDNSAPAPLPEISQAFSLTMPQSNRPEKEAVSKPRRGIPFQTPTAPALRNRLEIGRSLRPLMRKVESYTNQVLDEAATAELTAQQQFCMPVMRPERERWLELALVIEDSASSFLWREVIRDFRQVLERQGAFRTVTTWYLQTTSARDIQLFAQRPQGGVIPRPRSPKELLESSGRRLIFFISDCISPAWQQGALQENYLALWAKHGPVAIVQMLPARLWHRTALAEGERVPFFARSPGVPNAQLLSPALFEDTDSDLGLKLPTVTVEPASIAQWARLIAGFGDASAAGVWFEPDWQGQTEASEASMASSTAGSTGKSPATSEDVAVVAARLVGRFSTTASDMARELAALMALVPVELSLVYIIQAKLLPESTPLHVAEVFLSGLVERVKDDNTAEADLETGGSFFATRRRYDFVPGVRNILIDSVKIPSAERVLNEISAYICERLNRSSRNFMALLRLGDELDAEGEEFAEFARVTKQALRRLGGEYAALVEDIERPTVPPPDEVTRLVSFPPLERLAFEKGELIDSDRLDEVVPDVDAVDFPPSLKTASFQVATVSLPQQTLEVFEFQAAKIEQERAGIFRRLQWVVKKSRAQARRFVEPLADELMLEMVSIPGGTFMMGSAEDEPDRQENEIQHEVSVPPFFLGRYPITQAQWRVVADLPQVNRELKAEPSRFKGENLPVEQVSWYEAVEFCDRLAAQTGHPYRLPSEAEWEYACRAGTTTPFHFGRTLTTEVANYYGESTYADGPKGEYRETTTPVDHFEIANAFGLSDMHGNVWEWCQDHYDSYDKTPIDGSVWVTSDDEKGRVLRGGSWGFNPRYCRSAYRSYLTPDFRGDSFGFRVSCSAPRT